MIEFKVSVRWQLLLRATFFYVSFQEKADSLNSLGYIQPLAIFQQYIKWIVQFEHGRWT